MRVINIITTSLRNNTFKVGVTAALVAFFSLASLTAMSSPLLQTADEALHLDYAWQLSNGDLPTLFEGPQYDTGLRIMPQIQWVWQHPPLFYALTVPIVVVAENYTNVENVVLLARLNTVVLGTMSLASAMLFIYLSLQKRKYRLSATLSGGMLISLSSILIGVSAAIYNDTVLFAITALSLGYTAYMIRNGKMRWMNYATLAVLLSLGMLSRSIFVTTFVVVFAAIAYNILTFKDKRTRLTHIGSLLLSSVVAILTSGWFYLRNYDLTGNILGRTSFTKLTEFVPASVSSRTKSSIPEQLTSYDFWGIVGSVVNGGLRVITLSFLFVVLLWVIKLVVDSVKKHELKVDTQITLMLTVFGLLQIASAAYYMSGGGGQHVRYLIPLLLPIAYFFARYIASIRANSLYLVAGIGSFYILSGYLFVRNLAEQHLRAGESFLTIPMTEVLKRGLLENDINRTYLVTTLVVSLLISSVVAVVATYALHRRQS